MTTSPNSEPSHTAFVRATLDWLEDREADSETVDDAFELLTDQRRRLFLRVMYRYDESLTLPDAAEEVARSETGRPVSEIPAERVANVYTSLYHDHLPRLTEADLLEYDQERDLVTPPPFHRPDADHS